MGIKVILATGQKAEDAVKIALNTGILRKEHEKICGAVIDGSDLRQIHFGKECNAGFMITPEYLSVVYRANMDDRALLVDYLTRQNPGKNCLNSPYGFGSDSLLPATP